jgi:hypothetical protein
VLRLSIGIGEIRAKLHFDDVFPDAAPYVADQVIEVEKIMSCDE